ncbi:MAG: hypothetical protein R3E57_08920 [Porticoccaceae bacterium]
MKLEFYNQLVDNAEFCRALGRVMLASSKLEIELKQYLRIHGKDLSERAATLGNLIKILKKNGHLTTNGEIHFGQVNLQRNYLVHNLYGSFVGEIENWLLPIEDLVPEDIELYVEKTELTANNLIFYSKIVCDAIKKYNDEAAQKESKTTTLL